MTRSRYEYAVRYRRASWSYRQVRFFQSLPAAHRLARRLRTPNDRWAELLELTIERREVGPWVEVES